MTEQINKWTYLLKTNDLIIWIKTNGEKAELKETEGGKKRLTPTLFSINYISIPRKEKEKKKMQKDSNHHWIYHCKWTGIHENLTFNKNGITYIWFLLSLLYVWPLISGLHKLLLKWFWVLVSHPREIHETLLSAVNYIMLLLENVAYKLNSYPLLWLVIWSVWTSRIFHLLSVI